MKNLKVRYYYVLNFNAYLAIFKFLLYFRLTEIHIKKPSDLCFSTLVTVVYYVCLF